MAVNQSDLASQALEDTDLARELEELIAALDRRVPRVERAGEAAIAHDAAALRARAFERLEQLSPDAAAQSDPCSAEPA